MKIIRPNSWSDAEIATLKELYPVAHWDEIDKALPNRNRLAIKCYAQRHEIRRPKNWQSVLDTRAETKQRCKICQEVKPLNAFNLWKDGPRGRQKVCKECRKAQGQTDGAKAYRRAYRQANLVRARARDRARHQRDKPKRLAAAKAYRKVRGRRAECANRRAKKLAAEGSYTPADVQMLIKQQNGRCHWCGKKLVKGYHVDHRIPLAKGGSNWPSNLVIAHAMCNSLKQDKMPWEFMEGRLL